MFLSSKALDTSIIIEKLKAIVESSSSSFMDKEFSQAILDVQMSKITVKDFNSILYQIYCKNRDFFEIHPTFTSVFLRVYIFILQTSSDFVKVIDYHYNLAIKLQHEFSQMLFCHILGIININVGKIEKAREFSERSIKISSANNYYNQYATKNNLGIIYTAIGSYEEAQEIFDELYKKFPQNVIYALNLAGNCSFLGKYEKGIQVITEFETNYNSFKSFYIGIGLDIKFGLYLRLNQFSKALEVEKDAYEIQNVVAISPLNKLMYNRIVAQRYQYEGNFSLAKQKMEDVLKIAEKLNQLNELFSNYILLIGIQMDLVISRPTIPEYRNQLFSIIEMIIKLSEEQNIKYQKVKLLILRSEIFNHYNLITEANQDLQEAKILSESHDLGGSFKKISQELTELKKKEVNSDDGLKTSSNFLKRLKDAFKILVGSPINNSELKKVDYTIHGILILTDSGLSVFNYYFTDMLQSDPNLISGLILAITSFISELSKGKGILKSIRHDNLSLILEPIDNYLCVSISSQECFDAREKTRKFASLSRKIILDNSKDIEGGTIRESMLEKLLEKVKLVF